MGFHHAAITAEEDRSVGDPTAFKTAITAHWKTNIPNIYLMYAEGQENPITLGLECTQEVYEFLHRQDTFNEPAEFLRGLDQMLDEAKQNYPSAERHGRRNIEARREQWLSRVQLGTADLVIEYNNRERTRAANWRKEVAQGSAKTWTEYNKEQGGSLLPFNFGPSMVDSHRGIESRSVQSIFDASGAMRAVHRARVRDFLASNQTNAASTVERTTPLIHHDPLSPFYPLLSRQFHIKSTYPPVTLFICTHIPCPHISNSYTYEVCKYYSMNIQLTSFDEVNLYATVT
jgi:hypothetical protein